MSHHHHDKHHVDHKPVHVAKDVNSLRTIAGLFLLVLAVVVIFAIRTTHQGAHRAQHQVSEVVIGQPVAVPSTNTVTNTNPVESEGKAATSLEVNAAPSHSAADDTLPAITDLRPAIIVDAPAVAPPVVEAPAADAAVADTPVAPAADEAQYAEDHPTRISFFRPRYHHHHQPRPVAYAHAPDDREHDFVARFFRLTARLAGLIQ